MLSRIALLSSVLIVALAFAPMRSPGADCQARFSNAPCYLGSPDYKLTRAVVDAAGGPGHTSWVTLLQTLAGPNLGSVQAAMEAKYGKDAFNDFVNAGNFAMQDGAGLLAANHLSLPAAGVPPPGNPKALYLAIWNGGSYAKGKWDPEYLLDYLFGHDAHAKVMDDIDAKYGKRADAYFHVIFATIVNDMHASSGG